MSLLPLRGLSSAPCPARPPPQVLAKAQRERLQVMLDEIKGRSGDSEARYRAALDGRSLGTHSVGTSAGAVAIQPGVAPAAAAGKEQPAAPPSKTR